MTLQPNWDADGEGLDFWARVLGHYSAASISTSWSGSGATARSPARSATRLRIPAACSVTEIPSVRRRSARARVGGSALLRGIELIPHWLERAEHLDDLALFDHGVFRRVVLPAHRSDRTRHHPGRREHPSDLVEHQPSPALAVRRELRPAAGLAARSGPVQAGLPQSPPS